MKPYSRAKLISALALFVACSQSDPVPKLSMAPEIPLSPAFDLGAVVDQVHFAYRQEGTAWTAGHSTYVVRVEGGALDFTPYHHPNAKPETSAWWEDPPVVGATVRFGAAVLKPGGLTGSVRVGALGQLLLERRLVLETLKNSRQGVEQSWRFEAVPEGAEALEVRVPVLEGRFLGATPSGLHFAAGALMVSYGHGTWVDAAGRRSAVPARFEQGAVVLRVPREVLATSQFPAVLDPVIGPEFEMDTPVFGPADNSQSSPAIAWDGTNHLVVWADLRGGSYDLVGARVSATGTVLDVAGFVISAGPGSQAHPALAWDGTNYLVVWQNSLRAVTCCASTVEVYGARVSAGGTVLDATPIVIAATAGTVQWAALAVLAAVAWAGTHHLVVWVEVPVIGKTRIWGARVSAAGVVQDASGIAISAVPGPAGPGNAGTPAVAWDGTNSLVVWVNAAGAISGARVSPMGTVLDTPNITIADEPFPWASQKGSPALAWDGVQYLVVWYDGRTDDIYGTRVTAACAVLDPLGIPISTAVGRQYAPAVASDGTDSFVVWQDNRSGTNDIYGARVSAAGTVQDSSGIAISTGSNSLSWSSAAVAWGGAHYLVAWADPGPGRSFDDIRGSRVSPTGTVQDPSGITISTAANYQDSAAVASDGTSYLVVWVDGRGPGGEVYGTIVSAGGVVSSPSSIAISATLGYEPAVAWDGTNYLVVWADGRNGSTNFDIYGTRVSASGVVQDPSGIPISTMPGNQHLPAVAWDGTRSLVVWADRRAGTDDIYGARVSAGGTVQDPLGILVSTAQGDQSSPAVVWNGTESFVVWQDSRAATDNLDIYGTRVSTTGVVQDPSGIAISTAPDSQTSPAVAWGGGNYLVVWGDPRGGTRRIFGATVSSTGTVQEPAGIDVSSGTVAFPRPAVAWNGTHFLAVWSGRRSGTSFDLLGARVSAGGVVQDASGIDISAAAAVEFSPAIAPRGDGQLLLVYSRGDAWRGFTGSRVFGRVATFNERPVATPTSVTTPEDTSTAIILEGSDVDGDPLSYVIVSQPAHGVLTASATSVTYTPSADFHGPDSFTFKASDGALDSTPATVSITVTAVNDAPEVPVLVSPGDGEPVPGGEVSFSWRASEDLDGDAVSYRLELTPEGETPRALPSAGTSLSLAETEALAPGNYLWRVEALDTTSLSSGYSAPRAFVVPVAAAPPMVVAPRGCGCSSGGDLFSVLFGVAGLMLKRRDRAQAPCRQGMQTPGAKHREPSAGFRGPDQLPMLINDDDPSERFQLLDRQPGQRDRILTIGF